MHMEDRPVLIIQSVALTTLSLAQTSKVRGDTAGLLLKVSWMGMLGMQLWKAKIAFTAHVEIGSEWIIAEAGQYR